MHLPFLLLICSYSHEQKFKIFGSLVTPNISFKLQFLHVLTNSNQVCICKIMLRIQRAF
jgi:hypothetical protein